MCITNTGKADDHRYICRHTITNIDGDLINVEF